MRFCTHWLLKVGQNTACRCTSSLWLLMDVGHPVETTMFAGYATKHSYAIIGSDEAFRLCDSMTVIFCWCSVHHKMYGCVVPSACTWWLFSIKAFVFRAVLSCLVLLMYVLHVTSLRTSVTANSHRVLLLVTVELARWSLREISSVSYLNCWILFCSILSSKVKALALGASSFSALTLLVGSHDL